jgi:hypothetical protein
MKAPPSATLQSVRDAGGGAERGGRGRQDHGGIGNSGQTDATSPHSSLPASIPVPSFSTISI